MYAVIQSYSFDPTSADEIHRQIQHGVVPLLRRVPGFAAYYWLNGGDGNGASFSVWEDAAAAEHSVQLAADYLREHLATVGASEVIPGEVAIHVTSGL